jgi:hypothetical protein
MALCWLIFSKSTANRNFLARLMAHCKEPAMILSEVTLAE